MDTNGNFGSKGSGAIIGKRLVGALILLGLLLGAYRLLPRSHPNEIPQAQGCELGLTPALLPDGRVLLVGGYLVESLRIVDPKSGSLQIVSMPEGRAGGVATVLKDGRVLVLGGRGTREVAYTGKQRNARIFSPKDKRFSASYEMNLQRMNPYTATLSDGRILVLGGTLSKDYLAIQSTEIFDPNQACFTAGPSLPSVHQVVGVAAVQGNRILVVGTSHQEFLKHPSTFSAEDPVVTALDLYESDTGKFRALPPLPGFQAQGIVPLPNGKVWVLGWEVHPSTDRTWAGRKAQASSMIFDSVTSTLIKGPDKLPMLGTYSQFGGGSLPLSLNIFCTLDDNRIFFLGTSEAGGAGIYDLNQGSFAPLADRDGRIHGLGVVQPLNDGRVLVAGGWNDIHDPSNPAAAIEIFDPATARYIQLPKPPKEEGKQRSLRNFFFPVTP